jgi:hypothetical protein
MNLMEISIHIHEDDWGMRNLYPAEASREAVVDMHEASEASLRNLAPNGVGWTDVHLIKPPSVDYASVGLALNDACSALEPLMPRVRQFTATATAGFYPKAHDPLGSYEQDAFCYGFGPDCFIKLEPREELMKRIWFECTSRDPEKLDSLRAAVLAINELAPSVIADYWNDMTGAVSDIAFLDRYFQELRRPA